MLWRTHHIHPTDLFRYSVYYHPPICSPLIRHSGQPIIHNIFIGGEGDWFLDPPILLTWEGAKNFAVTMEGWWDVCVPILACLCRNVQGHKGFMGHFYELPMCSLKLGLPTINLMQQVEDYLAIVAALQAVYAAANNGKSSGYYNQKLLMSSTQSSRFNMITRCKQNFII